MPQTMKQKSPTLDVFGLVLFSQKSMTIGGQTIVFKTVVHYYTNIFKEFMYHTLK